MSHLFGSASRCPAPPPLPLAAACLGFEQSMYIQVHAQHVYVQPICCSSVKYCTCHRATKKLFSCSYVQLFLRSTVQLSNCSTVQLCNCATVQLSNLSSAFRHGRARATTSAAVETSSTPHLLHWHHLHFPQHQQTQQSRHANLPQADRERDRMNVGYHCLPDWLANILRLSSRIKRSMQTKEKTNK